MIWDFLKYQDNTAVETEDRSLSYVDLHQITSEIASHIPERALVFVLAGNTVGSLAGYAAFLNHGIVPLMLDEKIDRDLLADLTARYRPQYLWAPEEASDGFGTYEAVFRTLGYVLLKTNIPDPWPLHEDLALLINTTRENCKVVENRISDHFLVKRQRTGVEFEVSGLFEGRGSLPGF